MADDFVDTATDSWAKVQHGGGDATNGTYTVNAINNKDIGFIRQVAQPADADKPSAIFDNHHRFHKWAVGAGEFIWRKSAAEDADFGVIKA